ncbi:hypothetical protein [Streptomyces sp. BH105]|uniref:hypothetical protein n=1 Tax=Streptomyces sp. BH105 TaxID=3410408 RepID=UPI003CF1C110
MDTFNAAVDTLCWAAAWIMGTALAISLLSWPFLPALDRAQERREARKAAEDLDRRQADYLDQLQEAADRAVGAAIRAQLAEPLTADLQQRHPLCVTTSDVVDRAHNDFALRVPRKDAAAMLRERLELRGHVRFPDLITDAYDQAPGT